MQAGNDSSSRLAASSRTAGTARPFKLSSQQYNSRLRRPSPPAKADQHADQGLFSFLFPLWSQLPIRVNPNRPGRKAVPARPAALHGGGGEGLEWPPYLNDKGAGGSALVDASGVLRLLEDGSIVVDIQYGDRQHHVACKKGLDVANLCKKAKISMVFEQVVTSKEEVVCGNTIALVGTVGSRVESIGLI